MLSMPTPPHASSSSAKPDRLYVGNLAPTVDEYTLLQVCQKYGKITKLDFMFHKSGALKGKPRGYAFVEFTSKDDALKAMVKLHDRLLRGRKLVVTYANSYAETKAPPTDLPPPTKGRRMEPAKTTTLSLLKSQKRSHSAAAQIAAMEAKLASMQSHKPVDEDYVPGQSFRVSPAVNSPDHAGPTGTDEEEMDLEEELGLTEGAKAAEDLEREMREILAGNDARRLGDTDSPSILASKSASAASTPQHHAADNPDEPPVNTAESSQDTLHLTKSTVSAGLPKRPISQDDSGSHSKPAALPALPRPPSSLPKKPSFL